MINFARLEQRVMNDEGFRSKPYLDSVGVPTIGYGTTKILDVPVTLDTPAITKKQARHLLRSYLYQVVISAQKHIPIVFTLCPVRQEVLINMGYNLGIRGLLGFRKFLPALSERDWTKAAAEMEDSRWWGQVGPRAVRLQQMILTGRAA